SLIARPASPADEASSCVIEFVLCVRCFTLNVDYRTPYGRDFLKNATTKPPANPDANSIIFRGATRNSYAISTDCKRNAVIALDANIINCGQHSRYNPHDTRGEKMWTIIGGRPGAALQHTIAYQCAVARRCIKANGAPSNNSRYRSVCPR